MSTNVYNSHDPSRGVLRLDHDPVPRDMRKYTDYQDDESPPKSHRYQGFPETSFVSPREPPKEAVEYLTAPDIKVKKRYGKASHLNPEKPLAAGEYMEYGSGDVYTEAPGPRPIRDPFGERSSAEVQRRFEHHLQVEDDIQQYKKDKVKSLKIIEDEKRKDMEMLKSFHPWGKPGAGAPSDHIQRRQLNMENVNKSSSQDFYANFGKPGAGAPRVTKSGNIQTDLRGDAAIRFQGGAGVQNSINDHMRYAMPPEERQKYAKDLVQQMEYRVMTDQKQRIDNLRTDLDFLKQDDQFGKPGGGAPIRTKSESNNLNAMDFDSYDPWGKGAGQPRRKENGKTIGHKNADKDKGIVEFYESSVEPGVSLDIKPTGGGGAPHTTPSGHVRTKFPTTMKNNGRGGGAEVREDIPGKLEPERSDVELPFILSHRGGGGAPLRDSNGKIITKYHPKSLEPIESADERKRIKAKLSYLNELQTEIDEQRKNKQDIENYIKAPTGDLAAKMNEGQVGKPQRDPQTGNLVKNPLSRSDITKHKMNVQTISPTAQREYHDILTREAEERYMIKELDKLKDKQEVKQHQVIFNNLWGKPGAGAPLDLRSGNKKPRLVDMLYSPRAKTVADEYLDSKSNPETIQTNQYVKLVSSERTEPTKYVRSTINSNSSNRFECPVDRTKQVTGYTNGYHTTAPWATQQA